MNLVCNCAAIPPTMPTYRKYHLPSCPCSPYSFENPLVVVDETAVDRLMEILNRRQGQ